MDAQILNMLDELPSPLVVSLNAMLIYVTLVIMTRLFFHGALPHRAVQFLYCFVLLLVIDSITHKYIAEIKGAKVACSIYFYEAEHKGEYWITAAAEYARTRALYSKCVAASARFLAPRIK